METGLIIWAVAAIVMVINMILIFVFEDGYAPFGVCVHVAGIIATIIAAVIFGIDLIHTVQA